MIWYLAGVGVVIVTLFLIGVAPIYAAYIQKDHNDLL